MKYTIFLYLRTFLYKSVEAEKDQNVNQAEIWVKNYFVLKGMANTCIVRSNLCSKLNLET